MIAVNSVESIIQKKNNQSEFRHKYKSDVTMFLRRYGILYLFLIPALLYYIIFHYIPMYGTLIAFKNFNPYIGILESPWVGLKHFLAFFDSIYFFRLIRNTFAISVFSILFGFPVPIIFALLLNEIKSVRYRSIVQSISYLPNFVSTVVIAGIIFAFLSPSSGLVNAIITKLGGDSISFMIEPAWFRTIYVASGIWQTAGWNSIIYFAVLSSISPSLFEAADMDGAGRLQKIIHISLPSLLPTISTLLLLNLGGLMSVGFEKAFLLYTPSTYETGDVLSTYVYRSGLINQEFSFAAAVDLFNSLLNIIFIIIFNKLSKKISGNSLW